MKEHLYIIKLLIFVFVIISLWTSCETQNTEPVFDVTPKIELLSLSNTELVEFKDTLTLLLRYEDGDGDLGNSNPDINSVFVQDSRLDEADEYYLSPLAPEDAGVSITGNLNIRLAPTFILGNGNTEETTYTIYINDRAGNQSNVLETEPITITRE